MRSRAFHLGCRHYEVVGAVAVVGCDKGRKRNAGNGYGVCRIRINAYLELVIVAGLIGSVKRDCVGIKIKLIQRSIAYGEFLGYAVYCDADGFAAHKASRLS